MEANNLWTATGNYGEAYRPWWDVRPMIGGNASVSSRTDNRAQIMQTLKNLMNTDVLVGIPEAESSRPGEMVTNAELLFIHTNGSPLKGIPARPVIEPAIENKKDKVADKLKVAMNKALEGDEAGARKSLEAAGMYGQNIARGWFTNPDNGWPPNAESTIKAKGSDKPLIDTGEMRKAITYVVRDTK